jgi:hypothetical protein
MSLPDQYHVPAVTALWMLVLPPVFWFFGGAGAGTVFDFIAQILTTCFRAFGGPSLIFGFLLLVWTLWRAWRAGVFSGDETDGGGTSLA